MLEKVCLLQRPRFALIQILRHGLDHYLGITCPVCTVFFCMISVLSIGDLTKLTSHSCSLFLFMNGLCIKALSLYLLQR